MATRVRYLIADGILTLPVQYGAGLLGPGDMVIIADTPANVLVGLGNPDSNVIELVAVPDGQTGAITPGVPGATSAAAAAISATAAAASVATAQSAAGYTGGTSAYWSTAIPSNTANALDRLARRLFGGSGGATGPIAL